MRCESSIFCQTGCFIAKVVAEYGDTVGRQASVTSISLCSLITATLHCVKELLSLSTITTHTVTHGNVAEWTCWLLQKKNNNWISAEFLSGREFCTSRLWTTLNQVQKLTEVTYWPLSCSHHNCLFFHFTDSRQCVEGNPICEKIWSDTNEGWDDMDCSNNNKKKQQLCFTGQLRGNRFLRYVIHNYRLFVS